MPRAAPLVEIAVTRSVAEAQSGQHDPRPPKGLSLNEWPNVGLFCPRVEVPWASGLRNSATTDKVITFGKATRFLSMRSPV